MLVCSNTYARDQLTLQFEVEFQYTVFGGDKVEWIAMDKMKVDGIGALQVKLNKTVQQRLIFTVKKPFDLKSVFKIRTPQRSDGIVGKAESDSIQIILGPHQGCPEEESRCKPITLDDVGNIELRLELYKAQAPSFGVLLFRPYSQTLMLPVRPSVSYKNEKVACDSHIETEWFIFARDIEVSGAPDIISLCIEKPNGDKECAEDRETEVEVTASQSGKYNVVAWNTTPFQTVCSIYAN